MTRGMKRFLTICGIVICVGLGLTLTGWLLGGTKELSGVEDKVPWISFGGYDQEFRTLDVKPFSSIDLECDMGSMEFIEDEKFAVEMRYDKKQGVPQVEVKNDTLVVRYQKSKNWFLNFDLFNNRDYPETGIKIHYPKGTAFQDLRLENDMGDAVLKDIETGTLTISADAGDVRLKRITAPGGIYLDVDMGDVNLKDIQTGTLDINADSGDAEMERIAADLLKLEMDMGSVDGTDMRTKGTDIQMNMGDVSLAGTLAGTTKVSADMGSCTLQTDLSKDSYSIQTEIDLGECSIDGKDVGSSHTVVKDQAKNKIKVEADDGDVEIDFL